MDNHAAFGLALALSLTACTSWKLAAPAVPPAPLPSPPPDRAQICVVRATRLAWAVPFPVRDDGVLVGATRGRSHFCYLAAPGPHLVTIEADQTERAQIFAEPGRTYFLKQEVDNVLGWVRCRAVWVTEAVARDLVAASSYEVLVGVPGMERLPPELPLAPALQEQNSN